MTRTSNVLGRSIGSRAFAVLVFIVLVLPSIAATAATYSWTTVPVAWIDPSAHTVLSANTPIAFRTYAGCGTAAPVIDDDLSDVISLGFIFRFGSIYVDSVRIQSNGRVQFLNQNPWYGATFDNAYC